MYFVCDLFVYICFYLNDLKKIGVSLKLICLVLRMQFFSFFYIFFSQTIMVPSGSYEQAIRYVKLYILSFCRCDVQASIFRFHLLFSYFHFDVCHNFYLNFKKYFFKAIKYKLKYNSE